MVHVSAWTRWYSPGYWHIRGFSFIGNKEKAMTEKDEDLAARYVAVLMTRITLCPKCPDRKDWPCAKEDCPLVQEQHKLATCGKEDE